jgi:hypothetical protein
MLYDGLFAIDLPATPGPRQPVGWLEGLDRLLFTGHARVCHADCHHSAALVLARCHAQLRERGASTLAVHTDADELLSLQVVKAPGAPAPRWPDLLPAPWVEEPCAFRLRARIEDDDTVAVVHARYIPRHPVEVGGLTGAVRLLWHSPTTTLPRLERRVEARGQELTRQITADLSASFEDSPGSFHGRVIVPWGRSAQPDRFSELLAGFTAQDLASLDPIEDQLLVSRRVWPAIDPDGVAGRIRNGDFVPVEEVSHAS